MPDVRIFTGSLFNQKALAGSGVPSLSSLKALDSSASLIPAFDVASIQFHGPALSSRGCPLRCSYCASRFLHNQYEARPVSIVAEELAFMQNRFGIRHFAWYDDALLYQPRRHFISLMEAMVHAGVKATFHAPNGLHVRWLTKETLEVMRSGGFKTLRFGYESGSRAFRRDTGGKARKEELKKKTGLALQTGFSGNDIGVYVMAGLAGQTPQDVADEIKFVATLSVKAKPVFFSPVPKTPLFENYSGQFPQLLETPLSHNDTYFITQLPGWSPSAVQEIIDLAKWFNEKISDKVTE
ncbi:MAG TPA: radical SAM protein [Chitinivibrionales bacterium]|nr:radical SAM protein [Chitinivibrionales bacterium]